MSSPEMFFGSEEEKEKEERADCEGLRDCWEIVEYVTRSRGYIYSLGIGFNRAAAS